MRRLLLAGVLLSIVMARPVSAGPGEPEIAMVAAALASGAVPEVRIAAAPGPRSAAFYARTADGKVQAVRFLNRLTDGETGPVIPVPANKEQILRIGGSPGYFVAARTGLALDREAIIVLLTGEAPDGLDGLVPSGRASVPADRFFRNVAALSRHRSFIVHIVPYSISAPGIRPSLFKTSDAENIALSFQRATFETVLMIADILSVETAGPLAPIMIDPAEEGGVFRFRYRSVEPASLLGDRLVKMAEGLGLKRVRISGDASVDHLRLSFQAP